MEVEEITDLEAKVLQDYQQEFKKLIDRGYFNGTVVELVQSWSNYFVALCVKYGQHPMDMQIDNRTKKWSPREDK